MTLFEILLGAGLAAGTVVTGLVYLDCARRGLSTPSRLVWALACGGGSFAGFLVPHVLYRDLSYLYFQVLKPRPVTVHPREWLAVALTVGATICILLAGLYFAGTRVRDRTTTELK